MPHQIHCGRTLDTVVTPNTNSTYVQVEWDTLWELYDQKCLELIEKGVPNMEADSVYCLLAAATKV